MHNLSCVCVCVCVCLSLCPRWMRGVVLKVPEDIIVSKIKALGKVKRDEWIVLAAQLAQIIFWFSREPSVEGTHGWSEKPPDGINPHGTSYFNDGTVAIFWAFPLFLIPSSQRPGEAILSKAMLKHISWDIILMMGAGFAISKGVQESGTSDWLGAKIAGWIEFTPYLFMLLMVFVIANLTEVASNTATATILAPTLIAAAVSADKDPIAVCLPAIISCSAAWMLPMATPPNAIVFSAGRMTFSDMVMLLPLVTNCDTSDFHLSCFVANVMSRTIFIFATDEHWRLDERHQHLSFACSYPRNHATLGWDWKLR